MKIPPRNIEGFIQKPPANVLAILLYGPDEGLVRTRLQNLTKTVVADVNDPFAVVEFSGDQLNENPSRLIDEAQSISMLGGRRVVRLRDATDKVKAAISATLSQLKPGDNLVLVEAGELPPRSELRAMFEAADHAAAIPCYVEEVRDLTRILADTLKSEGYSISSEALSYMAANVVGDRAVAVGEAQKLAVYMGSESKSISLDDVVACVGNSAALSLDDLSRHIVSGRFAEGERILTHVMSEGMQAITILRTLQNYFLRLHLTKSRMAQGDSMETAMARLKPPVFFKQKPAFESHVSGWSVAQLEQALALLMAAETRTKQTGYDPETVASRVLLSLSQMAARQMGGRRRA